MATDKDSTLPQLTTDEVKIAVNKLSFRKAHGIDEVPNQITAYKEIKWTEDLLQTYCLCLAIGEEQKERLVLLHRTPRLGHQV